MSPSILLISYDLRLPSSTSASPNLSAMATHAIPIQMPKPHSESGGSSYAYYVALRDAIGEAKNITGRELTEWRDAVGDAEKEKTGGKEVDEQDEGAEEEEGDQQETEARER